MIDSVLERFGVYFCVIVLLFLGCLLAVFFTNPLNIAFSVAANISTVLAFLLALKAYWHWVRQETISYQKQVLREVLIDLVVLNEAISKVFSDSIMEESRGGCPILPSIDGRNALERSLDIVSRIETNLVKYYAIDVGKKGANVVPTVHWRAQCSFEGDPFAQLKRLKLKILQLSFLLRDDNILYFKDGMLVSSSKFSFSPSIYYNRSSFLEISAEYSNDINDIHNRLLAQIS
ncbi:hypothetical protein ND924_20725 [Vibrio diabolicus]|uniref:hypothetical protein n=1 Tax=Vibrio diabolicus TaxID=50719 RepID=UPI00215F6488|nr:hypothetical protein [Vibrio diabolicus]MCS0305043.1 hypothetical protein [Vibrio diabolicus]